MRVQDETSQDEVGAVSVRRHEDQYGSSALRVPDGRLTEGGWLRGRI